MPQFRFCTLQWQYTAIQHRMRQPPKQMTRKFQQSPLSQRHIRRIFRRDQSVAWMVWTFFKKIALNKFEAVLFYLQNPFPCQHPLARLSRVLFSCLRSKLKADWAQTCSTCQYQFTDLANHRGGWFPHWCVLNRGDVSIIAALQTTWHHHQSVRQYLK